MKTAPFQAAWPRERIDRLRLAIDAYPFPDVPEGAGWEYGCDLRFLQTICGHWADGYDFDAAQADLNRYPHFKAEVDPGMFIHFVHVVGEAGGRRPLMLIHGWPGSVYEFWPAIEALAFPSRHGGSAADAFDLVIPSLPGYAFSSKPPRPVGPRQTAIWFDRLMRQALSYEGYLVQGTDWGVLVAPWMAIECPEAVRGIHIEDLGLLPDAAPDGPEEREWYEAQGRRDAQLGAYYRLHTERPSSLAYLANANPVGQAAWMLERYHDWSDLCGRPVDAVYGRDRLLTSVNLHVLTDTFSTATWFYAGAEAERSKTMPRGTRVTVPTGYCAWRDPRNPAPPRSLVEKGYDLVHWIEQPRGGHFAATEEPTLFVAALRDWAASLT